MLSSYANTTLAAQGILVSMKHPWAAPGSLFGSRFEIVRLAGRGGMGAVYQARDHSSGELVALKLLLPSGSADEAERFEREAQFLSELRHPGIVSYVAHGQTREGQHFIAMEWLEGEDLAHRLQRGPLPLRECALLLENIAAALSAPHPRGIIHRDLKPSNLFLPGRELARVKILDFGVARRLLRTRAATQTGMVIGTPEYMAPEQARGVRDLTPAADIFSLGCVLYECLTGQPPFAAEHVASVLVRILFEEPAPVQELCPGLPESFALLLQKMLHKDPAQRVADASGLLILLGDLGTLPEAGFAKTIAGPARVRSSFAESEQSLLSIVLASLPVEAVESGPTLRPQDVLENAEQRALLAALQQLGVTGEFLASGALVVTAPQLGNATDQAALAARAGMLIRSHWPLAAVSLATGRGSVQGRSAIGEVVEQAASLLELGSGKLGESLASGLFVDELSARLLEGRFVQQPLQPGRFLLTSEKQESDVSRLLLGKPTPCVGREGELGILDAQLTSCIEDCDARALLITAPPGVGKSRLRHEFLRRVGRRGELVTLLMGHGDLTTAGAPHGILAQALRQRCGLSSGDTLDGQRQKLTAHLNQVIASPESAWITAFIGELCGVPFPDATHSRLAAARREARMMHEQIRCAFVEYLRAECQHATVLLVLDDLQWGDSLSVALVDAALHELRRAPLCVLALARPGIHEIFPKLWATHHCTEVRLKGLSRKACERLAQQVLGNRTPAEVLSRVIEQSGGNALFLEELIRAVGEGDHGNQPETVMAMLQARIGRFDVGPRRVVRAASVLGQTFWLGGVVALLGSSVSSSQAEAWLAALVHAEVIEPHTQSRFAGEQEFGFRHALLRDATYGLLTESDLTAGHELAARYLERCGEPEPLVLADHYLRGGQPERATGLYMQEGERADQLGALLESRRHYGVAKAVLDGLPGNEANQRLKIDVLLKHVQVALLSDPPAENLQRLAEARALVASLTSDAAADRADQLRSAWVEYLCGRSHFYLGQYGEALKYYEQALPLAEAGGDGQMVAFCSQFIGATYYSQGHVRKSLPFCTRAVALIDTMSSSYERLRALAFCGNSLMTSGSCREGMALHEQALTMAMESRQASLLTFAYGLRGFALSLTSDFEACLQAATLALEQAAKSKEQVYVFISQGFLGWAHSFLGDPEQALTFSRQSKQAMASLGSRVVFKDLFSAVDVEIALRGGDLERALAAVAELVPTLRQDGSLLALALAEQSWGLALARQNPREAAVADAHLAAALRVMEDSGQVMGAARLRLEWADLYRRRGRSEQAAALRAQAVSQFEAAGLPHVIAGIDRACALGWDCTAE